MTGHITPPVDPARLRQITALGEQGPAAVHPLIDALTEPSWVIRRLVVAALAQQGDAAVPALIHVLEHGRENETRNAAAADALVLSTGDVEAALSPLADHANAAIVYDVAQIFGRRRSGPSVALLTRLTSHPDDNVAVAAIEALGQVGGRAAVTALVEAASSGNFFRTFPAIDVLGRSGDLEGVTALLSLLGQPVYASEVVRALGHTGDERAVRPLVEIFTRPNDTLLRPAALALAEIDAIQLVRYGQRHVVTDALRAIALPTSLGRRIMAAMRGASESEQVALCRVLAWIGGDDSVESLLKLLHESPAVAAAAADGLASIGNGAEEQTRAALRNGNSKERAAVLPFFRRGRGAVTEVTACLEDPDPAVRAAACDALARVADTSAVEELFAALGDPDPRVAQAALSAIQSVGSPRTESLTLELAGSSDPRLRRAALRIVAYFGYPTGLPVLIKGMADPDEKLREAAIYGLPFIEDPRAHAALLEATSHSVPRTRGAAMRALGHARRTPEAITALRSGLADADAWVRYYSVQALGRLQDTASADEIIRLIDDPAGQVRVAVVDALAALATEQAFLALKRAVDSSDEDVRRAALLGLGTNGRPEAIPVVREALKSPMAATRLVALAAMAKWNTPEAIAAMSAAASDPEPSVRDAAVGFLAEARGEAATTALIQLLARPDLQALVLSSLATAVEGRIDGLVHALTTSDDRLSPLLIGALARMDRPDATGGIYLTLDRGSAPARKAAALAVASLGTVSANARLARAAREDTDREVRRICALAAVH